MSLPKYLDKAYIVFPTSQDLGTSEKWVIYFIHRLPGIINAKGSKARFEPADNVSISLT